MNEVADQTTTTVAQKIAWLLFCITCFQLVFLKSYVTVIAGVKADVFSSALCTLTFASCVLVAEKTALRVTRTEILVSVAVIVLAAMSGVLSSTPWAASLWTYVAVASGLAGFWCGRIVLNTPYRKKTFVWLCAVSVVLYSFLGWWGYYFHGRVDFFIDDAHLAVNLIVLLSFSLLSLLAWHRPVPVAIGAGGMGLAYSVLYLCGMVGGADSGVIVPTVMIVLGCFAVVVRSGRKTVVFLTVFIAALVASHYIGYASQKVHSSNIYQAQRFESYWFSWHIAKKHPLFGVGLRAPRVDYLTDYEMRHPFYTKQGFSADVAYFKTLQNSFLTVMVDLGIPFLLLYGSILSVLFVRLARAAVRPAPGEAIPPLALSITLTGAALHLCVMDLFLMTQIAWFFHVLLGIIPPATLPKTETELQPKAVLTGAATACAAILLGCLVGTRPSLDPKNFPSYADMSAYAKTMPLIGPFVGEKPRTATEETPAKVQEQPSPGNLVVHIRNYTGFPIDWGVLCIVDNSMSMARPTEPWDPSRLQAATDLVNNLARSLPDGSRIAVRAFADEGPLMRRGRGLELRVSRLVTDWTGRSDGVLDVAENEAMSRGTNNVCAAGDHALGRDMHLMGSGLSPRILILTDGSGECDPRNLGAKISRSVFGARTPLLDVIAVDMKDPVAGVYAEAVGRTHGVFIQVHRPEELPSALSRYLEVVRQPVQRPLKVQGVDGEHEIWPGNTLSLSAGTYTLTLPSKGDGGTSEDRLEGIPVREGQTTTLDLEMVNGRIIDSSPASIKQGEHR
jgi:hypothetical protein